MYLHCDSVDLVVMILPPLKNMASFLLVSIYYIPHSYLYYILQHLIPVLRIKGRPAGQHFIDQCSLYI